MLIPNVDIGNFNLVSVMLDAEVLSCDRSAIERTLTEHATYSTTWFKEPYWNMGPIIFWPEDRLAFHISFNGGNMRRSFWRECVYPRVEQFLGSIFILNANHPHTFPLAKRFLSGYQQHEVDSNLFSVPPVIALTGSDEPTAWDQSDIALYLRDVLSSNPFIRVTPKDWGSVKELLITSCAYFADFL